MKELKSEVNEIKTEVNVKIESEVRDMKARLVDITKIALTTDATD